MAQILLVVAHGQAAGTTAALLKSHGHEVMVATGFSAALTALGAHTPDLLVSSVRLNEHNGLHLVIRSQLDHPSMRAIVLDYVHDPVTEGVAHRHGATYLVESIPPADLMAHVCLRLADVAVQRRWRRARPYRGLIARVAWRPARVVDLSYGGVRLELLEPGPLHSRFHIGVPGIAVPLEARAVWTRESILGRTCLGSELLETNPEALRRWRRFVDSVEQSPMAALG